MWTLIETPEGRSVVVLAKERYGLRARQPGELNLDLDRRYPYRP